VQIVSIPIPLRAQLQKAGDRIVGYKLRIGAAQPLAEVHRSYDGLDEGLLDEANLEKLAGGNQSRVGPVSPRTSPLFAGGRHNRASRSGRARHHSGVSG
jgi:hypothetical protein